MTDNDIMNWLEDAAIRAGYTGDGLIDIAVGAGGSVIEVTIETWDDDARLFAAALVEALSDSHDCDAFYTFHDEEPDAASVIIACDRAPWEVEP